MAFFVFVIFGSGKIQDWNNPSGMPQGDKITMQQRKDDNGSTKQEVVSLMK